MWKVIGFSHFEFSLLLLEGTSKKISLLPPYPQGIKEKVGMRELKSISYILYPSLLQEGERINRGFQNTIPHHYRRGRLHRRTQQNT
jgi:hypothetical protein